MGGWMGGLGRLVGWCGCKKALLFTLSLSFTCHGSETTYRPPEEDYYYYYYYYDNRNKIFFFLKNYEEFAGGWMNVDENIIVS